MLHIIISVLRKGRIYSTRINVVLKPSRFPCSKESVTFREDRIYMYTCILQDSSASLPFLIITTSSVIAGTQQNFLEQNLLPSIHLNILCFSTASSSLQGVYILRVTERFQIRKCLNSDLTELLSFVAPHVAFCQSFMALDPQLILTLSWKHLNSLQFTGL